MEKFKQCILFTPAGRFSDEDLAPAYPHLQQLFNQISFEPIQSDGYFSGVIEARIHQFRTALEEAMNRPGLNWLMAVRGGYGTIDVADFFGKSSLSHDFVLSGFSDISILLNMHQENPHFYPVYGVNAIASIARDVSPVSFKYIRYLIRDFDQYNYDEDVYHEMTVLNPGTAKAEIFGGCLSVLVSTLSTPYFPGLENRILFLEDVSEPVYKIDRMLKQLELAGVLDSLAGVILGDFENCESQFGTEPSDVFHKYFGHKKYPVVAGFPMGHGLKQVPLKFKWPVELTASDSTIMISYQKPG